jgi:transcriptional regulator with XRE-family HTH domain
MRRASVRDWATYLEAAMQTSGLSQAELARRSGIAESMISRWLRGVNQPDVPNLRRVRPVLGVSMLELLVAAGHLTLEESQLRDTPEPPVAAQNSISTEGLTVEQVRQMKNYAAFLRAQNAETARTAPPEPAAETTGEPLRYAAYGGARLSPEQQSRVREQVRRARDEAARTGQPVVYLRDEDDPPS